MLNDYQVTFLTLEIIYIVVVLFLAIKTNKNIGRMGEIRHFRLMQGLFILEALAQVFWLLNDTTVFDFSLCVNWGIDLVYEAAFGLCMYEWLRFIAVKVRSLGYSKIAAYAVRIHTVIMIVHMFFIVTSIWTGWVFYVDAVGDYIRGIYFGINILCCYSHWVGTMILIFIYRRKADRLVRHQLNELFASSLLPVVGGLLQLWAYNIPFIESTVMLGILFMFNILQEEQIKTDALTGLNNRAQFSAMYEKMLNQADVAPFLIFVTDIDGFKKINDTYGHLVGD